MIPNSKTKIFFSFSSNPGITGSLLHNTGYKLKKLNCIYIPLKAQNIKDIIDHLKINNLGGFSLSMPFKEKICKFLDRKDISVKLSGSCNTVVLKNNKLVGFNTDFFAIHEILKKLKLRNKEILLVGNGALAKNFYVCLKILNAKKIKLCSRNFKRYNTWNIKKNKTLIINWKKRQKINADILINATPIGMKHVKKKYLFSVKNYTNFRYYIDAVVKKENDLFLLKAQKGDFIKYISGLELSLHQGLRQFFIYTKKKISINIMKKKLNYRF